MIWCSPPTDQPYSSEVYDQFWATAQELRVPSACTPSPGWDGRASGVQRALHAATVLAHE